MSLLSSMEYLYSDFSIQLSLSRDQSNINHHYQVLKDKDYYIPWQIFKKKFTNLLYAANKLESEKIQASLMELLPSYRPINYSNTKNLNDPFDYNIKGEA